MASGGDPCYPPRMTSLAAVLNDPEKKSVIVDECVALIESEVKSKGLLLKAGYKTVKNFKPGFVRAVINGLLPDWAEALGPLQAEAAEKGVGVGAHLRANSGRAADAMLSVTDAKAEGSTNKVVKKAYSGLRGTAKKHVESAVPGLAAIVDKYVG